MMLMNCNLRQFTPIWTCISVYELIMTTNFLSAERCLLDTSLLMCPLTETTSLYIHSGYKMSYRLYSMWH